MNKHNPEYESRPNPYENDRTTFTDKFRELLPGIEFEESAEMLEARMAVSKALEERSQDADFLRAIWSEYAKICEQTVDSKTPSDANPKARAKLQIAVLVHKALIFREAGNIRRYGDDLSDAGEYAYAKYLDGVAEIINIELDNLKA